MAEDEEEKLFIKEVDEDLKRERHFELWKKYGNYVIGAAVGVVLATAGTQLWRAHRLQQNEAAGERFAAALALAGAGKTGEAGGAFAALADETSGGYATLARFHEAALKARKGDRAGAVAIYEALAADSGVNHVFRDLALLLYVRHGVDRGDPAALTARLERLTRDDNPWRFSARELTALLAERAGHRARARDILVRLGDDASAPATIRARARELLAALGGS